MDTSTTDAFDAELPSQTPLYVSPDSAYYFKQAGNWAVFLAIIGFVFSAFMLLAGAMVSVLLRKVASASPYGTAYNPMMNGTAATVILLIAAVLYFIPSLFLYQFGSRIKRGVIFGELTRFDDGVRSLKSFFKFCGIVAIIVIALYLLILVITVVGAASMSSLSHQ